MAEDKLLCQQVEALCMGSPRKADGTLVGRLPVPPGSTGMSSYLDTPQIMSPGQKFKSPGHSRAINAVRIKTMMTEAEDAFGELPNTEAGGGQKDLSPRKRKQSDISPMKKKKHPMDENEPLLIDNPDRYVMFPLKDHDIWNLYKKHVASFWTAEEIDTSQDTKDWTKLNKNEKHFIEHVLAFFAASDGIVLENLLEDFGLDVQLPEARCFYAFQAAMENIHSETYSLLIDTLVKSDEKKNVLFTAMHSMPCVKRKAEWAIEWMNNDTSFAQRLVAFACVEGIFFSGSFCALFWLKKRGIMPGLTFSNELISRDEGLHTEFACLLYNKMKNKLDDEIVIKIVKSAVECEMEFVTDALPVNLIGMNNGRMRTYIKYVADHLLHQLGVKKQFNVQNPFEWMEMISMQGKTNFFERRVGEYQKAGVMADKEEQMFSIDCDF